MPAYVWIFIAAAVICMACVLAAYLSRFSDRKKEEPVGLLHIVNDEDDGPYMFLELTKRPEELYSKDTVTFWVDNMPYEVMTANETRQENGLAPVERSQ